MSSGSRNLSCWGDRSHLSQNSSPTPSDLIQFIPIDQPDSLDTSSNIHASVNSPARSAQTTRQVASTLTTIPRSRPLLSAPQTKMAPQVLSIPQLATQKDEVWSAYLTTLGQQIYQQWQSTLPVKTDRPTKVRFVIDRQGHLTHLAIIQSSRDAIADQDAVQAVQTAAPFSHFPKASKEDRLRVTFTFEDPGFSQ